jgi:hypothetical protein
LLLASFHLVFHLRVMSTPTLIHTVSHVPSHAGMRLDLLHKEEVMHPHLWEALSKMRIDDLHRAAARYRFAHEVGRHRRRKAWWSAPRATREFMSRVEGEQTCVES